MPRSAISYTLRFTPTLMTDGLHSLHISHEKFPNSSQYDRGPGQWRMVRRRKEEQPWSAFGIILILILFFGLPILYAWLLYQVYYFVAAAFVAHHDLLLPVFWLIFAIPGMFLMCITIGFPIKGIQRLLPRERYGEFEEYDTAGQEYNNRQAMNWLFRVCACLFAFTLLATGTSGLVARSDHFTVKHVFSLIPRSYSYDETRQITYYKRLLTQKGGLEDNRHYKIITKDGVVEPGELSNEGALFDLLKSKGIPVRYADVDTLTQ